jgi:hypothetical protein
MKMGLSVYTRMQHAVRFWLLRRLPTCARMVEVMSQSMDRKLTLRERLVLKLHLWTCIWCVWYLEQLHMIRDAIRSQGADLPEADLPSVTLTSEARERIKRHLSEHR